MRIGIDARMLGPQCGGLGRYVEQLVKHLLQIDDVNQYILFLKKDNWDLVDITGNTNIKKVLADIPWYGWREQCQFSRIIKKERVDLMHFPHWNVPLMYRDPFVVTIHDLLLLHYPTKEASTLGPFSYWFKQQAFRRVLGHAAHGAKHIIAPSEFTRQDIVRMLSIPQEKISVTYEAPMTIQKKSAFALDLEKELGMNKPYALYVGVAYPHKNLIGLLNAWYSMEKKYGSTYCLVLAGKKNYFYQKIQEYHRKNSGTSSVIFTDFVSDQVLHELYARARLFVFPSLYEGFGLPPLEAMTYGVPVVSSNRTCLPEILGEGAAYVDPENIEQFAEVMRRAFSDEDVRFELTQFGRSEVRRYSWEKMAQKTLEIYTSL